MIVSHKSRAWQHENEWRLISKEAGLVSYKNATCVSRIILGPYALSSVRSALEKYCRTEATRFHLMKVNGFTIDFEEVSLT